MTIAHAQGLAATFRSGRILLGGHRGNPDECPENTLVSFRSAIEVGVDVIECDVHLSEDGGLPVIHDHLLDRTTDGSGLVRDYSMAELKRFDAGSWKDPRFKGERIPSLDEVLAVARGKVGVAIEIKNLPLPILTGVLEASRPVDILRLMDDAGADVFCPHWASIEPETAAELHAAGKLIGLWTVDDVFSLTWSKALPANAIYTNKPREIRP